MAVTNAGSSPLTFTNLPVGIQVTKITDTSADWASVSNSTYFYDKADGLVHYKNSSGVVLELFSAGGLTYFTEAEATTSPNNTVYVDSLTAAGSTTNVDVAIVPKGTGAFMLDIPDNAATGGNKRGANAIDMQSLRNNGAEVASGTGSFCGGAALTASGSYAVSLGVGNTSSGILGSFSVGYLAVASGESSGSIGAGNTSSGSYSFSAGFGNTASAEAGISLGKNNNTSGTRSCALGVSNSVSGQEAIGIGIGNTASGQYSLALGTNSSTFGIIGRQAYASIQEATVGDAQTSKFVLHERTTNATATTLTTNSSAASTNNQVILSNQSAYRFKGTIIGKKSGTTDIAAWDIDGLIVRGANAASTVLNINNVTLVQNTPAWGTPALSADTTNGGLKVEVTGAAATNIQWTAVIETTEVIYA